MFPLFCGVNDMDIMVQYKALSHDSVQGDKRLTAIELGFNP